MEKRSFVELAEMVYQYYTKCIDLDIAFLKADASEDEQRRLLEDVVFVRRVNLYKAEKKEELITGLFDLKDSLNEGIKLQVLMKLGKIIYPTKFKDGNIDEKETISPDRVILVGDE